MEYRIKDYTIKGQRIFLPKPTSIEDLRLIFNETQKKLICSTATKDNVTLVQGEDGTLVEVPTSVCSLNSTDLLTIKCDYGDSLEDVESKVDEVKEAVDNIDLSPIESKVEEGVNTLSSKIDNIDLTPIESKVDEGVSTLSTKIDNIDLSAVENKVQEESAAIQAKIDNIKLPEIDTTELAKQGDNPEATNSKILEEVQKIVENTNTLFSYNATSGVLTIKNTKIKIE